MRRTLLAAARDLLETGGVEAVTLREAARLAGVSHNAPYRHFPSRDALLAAVAAEGFEALRRTLDAAAAAEPTAALTAQGRAYLRFAVGHRPLFRLMFGAVLESAAHPDLAAAAGLAFAALRQVVAGAAPERAVEREALRAWALVHGLAHLVADRRITLEQAEASLA
ncbi:MAG: helix-turn-helix domain containing protein [Methylobacterium frigidaeris]